MTYKFLDRPTALHPVRDDSPRDIVPRPRHSAPETALPFGGRPFRPRRFRALHGATFDDRTSI